jgi:Flp pilus assembly secretin CpaC
MKRETSAMLQRSLAACIAFMWIQFACAEEITVLSFPDGETPSVITALLEEPQLLQNTTKEPSHESCSQAVVPDGKEALLQRKLLEVARLQKDIQQLRADLGMSQQILVKVQMLELSLTKMQKIGISINGMSGEIMGSADLKALQRDVGKALATSELPETLQATVGPTSFVDLLEKNHLAKVLARPTVVVVSGRPASVNVGGEIPVPSRQDSKAAVGFQEFGTRLDLLATTNGNERVRLDLRIRVSELDDSRSIDVAGSRIPALKVRQVDTAVEAKFGEAVAITGLIQAHPETVKTSTGEVIDRINETALMVVAVPELVESLISSRQQSGDEMRK